MKNILKLFTIFSFLFMTFLSAATIDKKEMVKELIHSFETGNPQAALQYISKDKYLQHGANAVDGRDHLVAFIKTLKKGTIKANVVRVFQDGNYVFTHTAWDLFGPKVGFDVFKFENGKIVGHWDNMEPLVEHTASGRSQFDGPSKAQDLDKTEANKQLVRDFFQHALIERKAKKSDYISTTKFHQHNPHVKDSLKALEGRLKKGQKSPFVFQKNHIVLGEGDFVLSITEGTLRGKHASFYDMFRVEDGKITEHWDTIEMIPPKAQWKNSNGKFGFDK